MKLTTLSFEVRDKQHSVFPLIEAILNIAFQNFQESNGSQSNSDYCIGHKRFFEQIKSNLLKSV